MMEMEDGEESNKRPRSELAAVKQERLQRRTSQGGDGQGCGLVAVEDAMQVPWAAAEAEVNLLFFHCFACQLPLKPPVHKCEGEHLVCGGCHGDLCAFCDPPTAYAPCTLMDGTIAAVLLPCRYKADGCGRKLMYHEAADHALQCAFAPCHCPGHGCSMWASPPALLDHIVDAHSWPVTEIRYGSACRLAVPPPWRGTHVLVERNGPRVFLVTLSDLCEATAVSVVCVREDTHTPAAAPRFGCKVWTEVASEPEKNTITRVPTLPSSSSSNRPGAELPVCHVVPPAFGNHTEDLLLSLRIEKI